MILKCVLSPLCAQDEGEKAFHFKQFYGAPEILNSIDFAAILAALSLINDQTSSEGGSVELIFFKLRFNY